MLRGPENLDLFRTKVSNARWYRDPLPGCDIAPVTEDKWPSVSTIKKAWSKPFRKRLPTGEGVVPLDALWAAEFTADNLEAINRLSDRDAIITLVATASGRTLGRKAKRGDGVHLYMEDIANGRVVDDSLLPADVEPYAAGCRSFIAELQPTFVASEFVCFNREIGYAGTADAIVTITYDGQPQTVLVDWKSRSGDHGAYEEEIAQIGGYSLAEYIVVRSPIDGTLVRMELPQLDGGLIVSLTRDGCEPYPVDLEEAQAAFQKMYDSWVGHREGQKAARKARKNPLVLVGQPVDLTPALEASLATVSVVPSTPTTSGSSATVTRTPTLVQTPLAPPAITDDDLFQARLDWLRRRVEAIKAFDVKWSAKEANAGMETPTQALAREWSAFDHIPTLRHGGPRDVEELQVVIDACWRVEGLYGMPFPEEEPGVERVTKALRREGMVS